VPSGNRISFRIPPKTDYLNALMPEKQAASPDQTLQMRSRELYAIIASLNSQERKYIAGQIRTLENSAEILLIYDHAAKNPGASRKDMGKATGLSGRRISDLLPRLETAVVEGLGHNAPDPTTSLELSLKTARKLMLRLENSAAKVLLREVYDSARESEKFDLMLQAIEIGKMMSDPYEIPGADKEGSLIRLLNLYEYEQLKYRTDQAKTASAETRSEIVQAVSRMPLMQSEDRALSFSARALFLAIRTRLLVFSGEYEAAADNQGHLVDLLIARPWLKLLPQYHLMREISPYVGLLIATEQQAEAEKLIFQVGNMDPQYARTELLKWNQLYPLRLSTALQNGDVKAGDHAMEEMLDLFDDRSRLFSLRLINRGLYYIAYYLLAKGDFSAARRIVLRMLRDGQSNSFMPFFLPMTKVLDILVDLEAGEWDDLALKIKNFRQTKAFRQSPFYRLVLNLFSSLTYVKSDMQIRETLENAHEEAVEMQSDGVNDAYFTFFDLPRWIQARQQKVTLIEIFRSERPAKTAGNQRSALGG
jgi:hypothetical protein